MLISVASFIIASCDKHNNRESVEQKVTCRIISPTDGEEIDPNEIEFLTIKGEGYTESGKITNITLSINSETIPEISQVPFSFEYPIENLKGQTLIIELTAEGDLCGFCKDTVKVTIKDSGPESGIFTDSRDGNTYKTITIGKQVWMAENLRYLPRQDFDISWDEPRFYIWYDYNLEDNDEMNRKLAETALSMYGAIYNWHAAMNGESATAPGEKRIVRGICPEGWHMPTREDWEELVKYIVDNGLTAKNADGTNDPEATAKALAIQGDDYMWILPPDLEDEPKPTWPGVEKEKNNVTGFSGIAIGFRACAGNDLWMQSAYSAGWWSTTSSENIPGMVHPAKMWSDNHMFITSSEFNPGVGLPVRCLKD